MIRRLGIAIVVAFGVAQLIPVARPNPPVTGDVAAPPAIAAILRPACYDCHSRETVWPWYARVAPVSWLVAHDVAEGREDLDFSTWSGLAPRRRAKLLGEVADSVAEGEMPPWYYVALHSAARLDDEARRALVGWARAERERALSAAGSTAGSP